MAVNEYDIRKDMIEVGRRTWLKGWVAANDGNFSVRLSDNEILTTATGQSKGFLTPSLIVKVDRQGKLLEGDYQPSSEIQMHLLVYEKRPDVKAVCHTHPPYCTAHAVASQPLSECVLPEIVVTLGAVPLANYGTPSTPEIPESLLPYIENYDAFLLQNHGALTLGRDIFQAYYRMESIEHFAHILFLARGLGAVNVLDQEQVEKLRQIRARYGLTGEVPLCRPRPSVPASATIPDPEAPAGSPPAGPAGLDRLVELITDKIMSRLQSS